MKLTLVRRFRQEKFTGGNLYIGRELFCQTIEDRVREPGEPKVWGETAIPYGIYQIALTMSNRFGRVLPELLKVPGFSGIRIHSGNTAADSAGCILVGIADEGDLAIRGRVSRSADTMARLMRHLSEPWRQIELMTITITDGE